MLLYPDDIDQKLNWPPGTAQRMARRRKLPHVLLPDGSVRFRWEEVEALLVYVTAIPAGDGQPLPKKGAGHAA